MPCYVTGSREGDLALDARDAREELQRVTRVACDLARAYTHLLSVYYPSSNGLFYTLSVETREWIREHKAIDARRRKKSRE